MLRSPETEKAAACIATPTALETSTCLAASDNSNSSKSRRRTQRQPNPKWASQNAWQARNLDKRAAHMAVYRAIRRGILVKPTHCEKCGQAKPLDAHHDDYSPARVLDLKFWCRSCHAGHHARLRKAGGL